MVPRTCARRLSAPPSSQQSSLLPDEARRGLAEQVPRQWRWSVACARTLVHQRHAQAEPVLQLMVHIHCGRVHNVVANGLGSARRSTKVNES